MILIEVDAYTLENIRESDYRKASVVLSDLMKLICFNYRKRPVVGNRLTPLAFDTSLNVAPGLFAISHKTQFVLTLL